ncbi:uncharacterized protein LOC126750430 [Anthonomus grandis grandis]|uniref:uncharacterized protein LOC126750430 n=1 Tax=Anthonomus grandis grandis TaxID=2921223 RepID=UPI0021655908|nr:uncharacterized protein LOC126750430 [Anthonomus grandis grandis]
MSSNNNNFNEDLTSEVGLPRPGENVLLNEENYTDNNSVPTSQVEFLLRKIIEMQDSSAPAVNTVTSPQIQLPSFDPSSKVADPEGWCCLIDEFVKMQKLSGIMLATSLSCALKGEAADWLIRCRPIGKTWEDIRAEFLSTFSKPTDIMELFEEAVNGRQNTSSEITLLDEGLHVLRLAQHLIKTCENEEALATLFACHVVGSRSEMVRKRLQLDPPKDLKSFCIALRGSTGKRPALVRPDPHISSKRRAFTPLDKSDRKHHIKCHSCGKFGHKSYECRTNTNMPSTSSASKRVKPRTNVVRCFTCGGPGHISTHCPEKEKGTGSKPKYLEKRVNLLEVEVLPQGEMKLIDGEI